MALIESTITGHPLALLLKREWAIFTRTTNTVSRFEIGLFSIFDHAVLRARIPTLDADPRGCSAVRRSFMISSWVSPDGLIG